MLLIMVLILEATERSAGTQIIPISKDRLLKAVNFIITLNYLPKVVN